MNLKQNVITYPGMNSFEEKQNKPENLASLFISTVAVNKWNLVKSFNLFN